MKEKEIIIRFSDELYNKIKEKAKQYNTTTSNIARILIFANAIHIKMFLNQKKIIIPKKIKTKEKMTKKISIFLKKEEYELLTKVAKKSNQYISTTIRALIQIIDKYIKNEIELKIKFLLQIDKLNFNFSEIEFIHILFLIYKKTNLTPCEILKKIISKNDKIINDNEIDEFTENLLTK